ncbi:hypothetical protein ACFLXI_04815 [Chloroflexota bacterium]
MNQYDESTAINTPEAVIYNGSKRFTSNDGIIMVDVLFDDSITNSVFFTPEDGDGSEIAVSGFFQMRFHWYIGKLGKI